MLSARVPKLYIIGLVAVPSDQREPNNSFGGRFKTPRAEASFIAYLDGGNHLWFERYPA